MLSQCDSKGEENPVAKCSRKFLPREERCSTGEKECLAMQMMNVLAYCYRPGTSMMGFLQVAVLQCFERCIC